MHGIPTARAGSHAVQGLLRGARRRAERGRGRNQGRLSAFGAQVPPRRQQGSRRGGQVQGGQRGLRGAARSRQAQGLRPVAHAWLPTRRRSAAAAGGIRPGRAAGGVRLRRDLRRRWCRRRLQRLLRGTVRAPARWRRRERLRRPPATARRHPRHWRCRWKRSIAATACGSVSTARPWKCASPRVCAGHAIACGARRPGWLPV